MLVASVERVGGGVRVGAGVFDGAAKAVSVKAIEKVATASVRICSALKVTVGVNSGMFAPQAVSNKALIINSCIPVINRILSILTPFHKRRYFT